MTATNQTVFPINIEDEIQQSYLDYAMSVIVGRALPDVRDGLKPVHRRVLYAMNELKNFHSRAHVKSARVVGEVIGKYHPHGDAAVYEAIVRMAQDFSMRAPLVDGQGNFGSIDGDPPAAQRYTEVRMTRIAGELLADLDKDTVPFVTNYDDTLQMPDVLPAKVPNLLINGSSGIAVGMATNIPPHNLREVIAACLLLIDRPEASIETLMECIQGPDFPTGAIINGRAGIVQAYRTGRGRISIRSRTEIVKDAKGRESILITEIPYMLNKARLIEKIAELIKAKKIEGITEIRDESDREGLRIVIEIQRGRSGELILNNLYASSQLEHVFGINCVTLVDGRPRTLSLKQMLESFLRHRREVVTRRTRFLLHKARQRGHILEGQAVALSNIDPILELIKKSPTPEAAREGLMSRGWASENVQAMLNSAGSSIHPPGLSARFGFRDGLYYLSEIQAQTILELRLHRLTGMEQEKLVKEYLDILGDIVDHTDILNDQTRLVGVIRNELEDLSETYGDDRKTQIIASQQDFSMEDLIASTDVIVTISHSGYAKTQSLDDYHTIHRGGRGRSAMPVRKEDFIEHLLVANTHDTLLCFSNQGKVYWLKVYRIVTAGRSSRGWPLINLLALDESERITAILPVPEYRQDRFILMATAKGLVKKTELKAFSRPRSSGLIAIRLDQDDWLVGAVITDNQQDVLLVSSGGKAVRFRETDIRPTGRSTRGVRGIRMPESCRMVGMVLPEDNGRLLLASFNGYGKCTPVDAFPVRNRGGQGVIAMKTSDRNGPLVRVLQVREQDEVMMISDQGTLLRIRVQEIPEQSRRGARGVRLINVRSGEHLAGLERIEDT